MATNHYTGSTKKEAMLKAILGTCRPCCGSGSGGQGSAVGIPCDAGPCGDVLSELTFSLTSAFGGFLFTAGDYDLFYIEDTIYEQIVDNTTSPCTVTIVGQGSGWFSDYFTVFASFLGIEVIGRFFFDPCSGEMNFSYKTPADCVDPPGLEVISVTGGSSYSIIDCDPYFATGPNGTVSE